MYIYKTLHMNIQKVSIEKVPGPNQLNCVIN